MLAKYYYDSKAHQSYYLNQVGNGNLYQYLNCKILHGGTLLQPGPNLSEDYVILSTKLKKGLRGRWKCFSF